MGWSAGGISYDGYDLISQVASDLTEIGAPTRTLWERINITVFLLWVVILGAVLWRTRTPQEQTPHRPTSMS